MESISSSGTLPVDGAARESTHSFFGLTRRSLDGVLFGLLPALLLVLFLSHGGEARGFDFQQFWQGGNDVVHGVSPYAAVDRLPGEAAARALDPVGIQHVFRFPYPAPTALALAPLGLLPLPLATAIFLALLVLCIPGALLVLGVRDWRCYGAAFLWLPILTSVRLGTLTPLLVLGTALAWRLRDRKWATASALAGVTVVKIFLWPLLVWLAASRRARAAATAAALASATLVAAWAALGFEGFTSYPALVSHLSAAVEDKGFSLTALALAAGQGANLGHLLGLATGGLLLAAAAWTARRRGGDAAGLALACAAVLLLSPIVWLHYFALLLVPVAITSPSLSAAWIVPVAFWATPEGSGKQPLWQIATALVVGAVTIALTVRAAEEARESPIVRVRRQSFGKLGGPIAASAAMEHRR
jgi:hypothetical protein